LTQPNFFSMKTKSCLGQYGMMNKKNICNRTFLENVILTLLSSLFSCVKNTLFFDECTKINVDFMHLHETQKRVQF